MSPSAGGVVKAIHLLGKIGDRKIHHDVARDFPRHVGLGLAELGRPIRFSLFPPIQTLPAHESREDDGTGSEEGDKRFHSFSLTGYRTDHSRAILSGAAARGSRCQTLLDG